MIEFTIELKAQVYKNQQGELTCAKNINNYELCPQLRFKQFGQAPFCLVFQEDLKQTETYTILPCQQCLQLLAEQNNE
jgi:hypothetical protein